MSRRNRFLVRRVVVYVVVIGGILGLCALYVQAQDNKRAIVQEKSQRETAVARADAKAAHALAVQAEADARATCENGNRRARGALDFITTIDQRSANAAMATLANPAATEQQRTNARNTLAALPTIQEQAERSFTLDNCSASITTTTTTIAGSSP